MSAPITLDWPSIIAASRESHAQWLAEDAAANEAAPAGTRAETLTPSIPIIFVASPYTAIRALPSRRQRIILDTGSRAVGVAIWRMGAVPLIPMRNSWGFERLYDAPQTYYTGYLALVRRCDALIALWGHIVSPGRDEEVRVAKQAGIFCCTSLNQLQHWLASQKGVQR